MTMSDFFCRDGSKPGDANWSVRTAPRNVGCTCHATRLASTVYAGAAGLAGAAVPVEEAHRHRWTTETAAPMLLLAGLAAILAAEVGGRLW